MVSYSLVKTAADESGDRQLAREAQWLRELAQVRKLEGQVPRLLDEGTNEHGRRFLVMSVAQGTGETRAFTPGHERFLASLGKARFRSTDFEVAGCCEQLNRSLAALEGCVVAATLDTLRGAYHDCETALLASLLDRAVRAVSGRFRTVEHTNPRLAAFRVRLGQRPHRGEPARRRAALPDRSARASRTPGQRPLPAIGDEARARR